MNHGRLSSKNDEYTIQDVYKTTRFIERMFGLLCRKPLNRNEALLIEPCSSVHTFGMRYSIDLLYLDKTMTIIKMVNALKPWRISACPTASAVLELPANRIEELHLETGQQLIWHEYNN